MITKERVTPTEGEIEAQIASIRRYQKLPEKMYKRKLLILIIIDILLVFNYVRLEYRLRMFANGLPSFLAHVLVYTLFFIAFYLVYYSIRHLIPSILKGTKGVAKSMVKIINPFHDKGYEDKALAEVIKGYKEENAKRKKKQGKSEPFLYYRGTKVGETFIEYLLILHVITYLQIWYDVSRWSGVEYISPIETKIFTIQIILTLIMYKILSKEPGRTQAKATEQLKTAFDYYCSPFGKPLLSNREKELFNENFKVSTTNYDSHIKGHWSKGVYNNQEFSYWTMLYVEDLKKGYNYSLKYNTDNKHAQWGRVSGTEMLTKRGMREVRGR